MVTQNGNSNLVVQSLWIGNQLSVLEQLTICSYLANGHQFHLYTYGPVKGIPEGTTILDANQILPEQSIFKANGGSLAIFADWFRWELLSQQGGTWVDMDLVCIKPFDFTEDVVFGSQKMAELNVAMLKFPAGHRVCQFMAQACRQPTAPWPNDKTKHKIQRFFRKALPRSAQFGSRGSIGGPKGFTQAAKHFGVMDQAKPYTYFYPVHATNCDAIFDRTFANDRLFSNTYALHLWNEYLAAKKIDKNHQFPPDSLIEQLKRQYL
ncbi:hypothetical protein GCM10011369_24500 [Neiella marina]|uniref:Alpha 1,4-glycosyltransferase domain-containing protein n=1 Tax=Neiella marina TaxID=508461 RepID=A0A8J2U6I7_9GAMM|nr:hypothetical protein [Neiella marina]GGA81627.1 hypothetical protein GCM10011369_24500 [Neiella marina]